MDNLISADISDADSIGAREVNNTNVEACVLLKYLISVLTNQESDSISLQHHEGLLIFAEI